MFGKLFANRNGFDRYSVFLVLVSLATFIHSYVWIAGVVLLGYSIFRAFSKNLAKRRKELAQFDKINMGVARFMIKIFSQVRRLFDPIKKLIGQFFTRFKQRKHFLFIKCPQCKKTLRLPRNKGRLQATCPLCKAEFVKQT